MFSANSTKKRALLAPAAIAALIAASILAIVAPGMGGQAVPTKSTARDAELARPYASRLSFSDPPTDDQLQRVGLFMQPLLATGATTAADNRALAAALMDYESSARGTRLDDVSALTGFIEAYPRSPWTPMLLVDLGALYRRTGHFSLAMAVWQRAWEQTRSLTDTSGRLVGDAAAAYLSQFEAYLGRKETLGPLLAEWS
jgi:hypothetical protein